MDAKNEWVRVACEAMCDAIGGTPSSFEDHALAAIAAVAPRIQQAERERCLAAGGKAWPKAHTYASENAELYRAQDEAARRVLAAIRALG